MTQMFVFIKDRNDPNIERYFAFAHKLLKVWV